MQSGPVRRCYTCALRELREPVRPTCDTCDGALEPDGRCRNPICNLPPDERWFQWVWAIASNTGELQRAIRRYKYQGAWGWSLIFGRVVAGYLERNATIFINYDLIVPSPTFTRIDGAARDHTGAILRAAANESAVVGERPDDIVVKTELTPKLASTTSRHERRRIAESSLRSALHVPDPARVAGRRVLVFDDIFTGGHTLREIARALMLAGAVEVSELVLARQPWA